MRKRKTEPPPKKKKKTALPEGCDWAELQKLVQAKHEPIRKYLRSGIGLELQKIDSEIAEDVMRTMMAKDFLVLPVHDSFITYPGLSGQLIDIMKSAYINRVNAEINWKPDPTFLEKELLDEKLPTDALYSDLQDFVDGRFSDPAYSGYRGRLKEFLDKQTDDWHRRFQVYKMV